MWPMRLDALAEAVGGTVVSGGGVTVARIGVDSRRRTPDGLFFALAGDRSDGHRFVGDALARGYAAAVVSDPGALPPGAAGVAVPDTLAALQRLASWWRRRSRGLWLGITGSVGKTLAKDALAAALAGSVRVAASPGSFNSQLGVALSVLAVPPDLEVSAVEAGVSRPGEMAALADMILPDAGLFTGLADGHRSAFPDRATQFREKLALFARLSAEGGWLLVPRGLPDDDLAFIRDRVPAPVHRCGDPDADHRWPLTRLLPPDGDDPDHRLAMEFPDRSGQRRTVRLSTRDPFAAAMAELAFTAAGRLDRSLFPLSFLEEYAPGPTRPAMWPSPGGVTLVSDACGDDLLSVRHATEMLARLRQPDNRSVLVLGLRHRPGGGKARDRDRDLPTPPPAAPFADGVAPITEEDAIDCARGERVDELVLVTPPTGGVPAAGTGAPAKSPSVRAVHGTRASRLAVPAVTRVGDPAAAAEHLRPRLREGDTVLFRGRREDGLLEAATLLLDRPAANRLTVDLQAVAENLARFRALMKPGGKVLAMVKAVGYGTQLVRLGRELERLGADWLGVSTPDEGAQLRRAGVRVPMLAMLCPPGEAGKAVRYGLAVALYSFELADALAAAWRAAGDVPPPEVHVKVDSGMGRLGVAPGDAVPLARHAAGLGLRVTGVMTHFAQADDPAADDATRAQLRAFDAAAAALSEAGFAGLTRHAGATAGAARFPEARYDLVRIGIGLYGWSPSAAAAEAVPLVPALALTSQLAVVTERGPGERIGYGGTFTTPPGGLRVGIIPMGYHDGLPWTLGGKGGTVWIRGAAAPIVGRISMDSAAVDLGAAPWAKAGDEVLVWGAHQGVVADPDRLADRAGTIAYELLARLGPRVQRVFLGD